jgi:hypothetical protein
MADSSESFELKQSGDPYFFVGIVLWVGFILVVVQIVDENWWGRCLLVGLLLEGASKNTRHKAPVPAARGFSSDWRRVSRS